MKPLMASDIVLEDTKKLCSLPYPNHPRGCPNVRRCRTLGDYKIFDIMNPLYLIYNYGEYLFDADNTVVAQIRGWGYLTENFGLSPDETVELQKQTLRFIVYACNKAVESEE